MPGGKKRSYHGHTYSQITAAFSCKFVEVLRPFVTTRHKKVSRSQASVPLMQKPDGCFLLTKYMKNTCRRVTFFKMQVDELKVDEWEEHVANVIKSSYDTLRSLKLLKRYPIQAKKNSRSIDIIEN